MKIFITGATGFLGRRVVAVLQEAGGHELYGLARSESSAAALEKMGVQPLRTDLNDPELGAKLAGVAPEAVIHLAAEIATQRSAKKLWRANHEGTSNLLAALEQSPSPLKRFLFASTVVTGDAHGELLTEGEPLNVETEYGRTKQASEKMLGEAWRERKFPAVIFRPSHVYGPGGWFGGILRDMRIGLFRIPGDGKNWWDLVHVDDVARAVQLLLERGVNGETYHVVDDTPVTMGDFFNDVARRLGKKGLGHAPVWLAKLLKGPGPIQAAVRSAKSSNAKLKNLGWNPRYPDYRAGLDDLFAAL